MRSCSNRLLKLLAGTAIVTTTVAGAAVAQDKPYEGTTITVLLEGHPSTEAIIEMLPQFEEETGIKVEPETVPYSDLTSRALLEFSTGSGRYDVVMDDWVKAIGYANAGFIAPLDEFMASETRFFDRSDFVPAYLDTMSYEGAQYGVPVYGESTFLMYRKDLFEEYGIAVPKTFEELREAAKTIQEGTDGEVAGITMRGEQGIQNVYVWSGFLWGFGGQWFDEDGQSAIDSPEAVESLEFFGDLLKDYGPTGVANFGWQENRLQFQQGKAAMTIDATVNGAFAEDPSESDIVGKVGYAPVPVSTDDLKGGSSSLAIHGFYLNENSDAKEASWLFMSWATAAEQQAAAIEIKPHSGVTSQSAMDSEAFQSRYGTFADAMVTAVSRGNTQYLPNVPAANEIINNTGIAISKVIAGTEDAASALATANSENNDALN
ncbi:ABC transporter substrate-binding protein [Notoacmeibacter ruber]|uniref:Sugar ABC transporter substrate-binding protein n=1 Tax=Notoacmeibacter ruber TaxID=2670375 RepID=A0A3L7J4Q1_9HYPH|nr:sugar ABC transporter substrate-binding protein [Notoacmeibacter ruber]RLQ85295.1 sugar ABC transporter substrate-binding protein [Notoacmeibacter ruber]